MEKYTEFWENLEALDSERRSGVDSQRRDKDRKHAEDQTEVKEGHSWVSLSSTSTEDTYRKGPLRYHCTCLIDPVWFEMCFFMEFNGPN